MPDRVCPFPATDAVALAVASAPGRALAKSPKGYASSSTIFATSGTFAACDNRAPLLRCSFWNRFCPLFARTKQMSDRTTLIVDDIHGTVTSSLWNLVCCLLSRTRRSSDPTCLSLSISAARSAAGCGIWSVVFISYQTKCLTRHQSLFDDMRERHSSLSNVGNPVFTRTS